MTTSTGTISSAGIGSGLDVNSIVTQLMAVESQPLTLLKKQSDSLNSTLSSIGQMQSNFSTLRDKSNALTSLDLWSATTATSSDSTAVKVSTATGAVAGSFAVSIDHLAVGQTVVSSAMASSSATLGTGTLTIELGSYTTTPSAGFSPKSGATPVTVSIGAGETSLTAIRDKINAAGAGVVAAIVNDASGARLSLRSKDTGAENAFRITATATSGNGSPGTGLSALAYDANAASSPMTRSVAADNAQATINGIAISSASNTLDGVVDGVTMTLLKPTSTPVSVDVATNTASIKSAITDFVTAFNSLASFISTQTAYNASSKTGGALQGDQGTLSLQSQLRNVINQASSSSSVWSRLSDIGISMNATGTLDTDSTKLDNALANPAELKKLLVTDGATNANTGFVMRFKHLADAALGSGGVFDIRTSGLRTSLSSNSNSQDAMQQRLDQTQNRLRAQYTALDTTMAQLNNLSSYMTQQITQLQKTTA